MNGLGSLSNCFVDSDPETLLRARRLRRKALAMSLAVEACLMAALLVWPLITPGVLPRQFNITPAPPFHGGAWAPSRPHQPSRPPETNPHWPPPCILCAPVRIPVHVPEPSGDEPPVIAGGGGNGGVGSGPAGLDFSPFTPGGTDGGGATVLPPPPPPHNHPLQVSKGVMEASLIHRVLPIYPAIARTMHLSGAVELRAIIGEDGVVRQLQVLSGNPLLAQAAIAAVRDWRYRPTLLSGKAVEVETHITVNFMLE